MPSSSISVYREKEVSGVLSSWVTAETKSPAALLQAEGAQHEPDDACRAQQYHAPDERERPGQHFLVVLEGDGSGVSRQKDQGGVGKGERARLPRFCGRRGGGIEGSQAAVGKQQLYLAGSRRFRLSMFIRAPCK